MAFDLFFTLSNCFNGIVITLLHDVCTVKPAAHRNWRLALCTLTCPVLDDVTPFEDLSRNLRVETKGRSLDELLSSMKFQWIREICGCYSWISKLSWLPRLSEDWCGAEGRNFRHVQRHEWLTCVADLPKPSWSCGEAYYLPDNVICLELHNDSGCNQVTGTAVGRPEGCDDPTTTKWLEIR